MRCLVVLGNERGAESAGFREPRTCRQPGDRGATWPKEAKDSVKLLSWHQRFFAQGIADVVAFISLGRLLLNFAYNMHACLTCYWCFVGLLALNVLDSRRFADWRVSLVALKVLASLISCSLGLPQGYF